MEQSIRACRDCGEVKPENGYGTRAMRCHECYKIHRRAKRHARIVEPPPNILGLYPLPWKVCAGCSESKRPWEFPKDSRLPHGLNARCKPCTWLKNRTSYKEHRPARLEAAARRRTPEMLAEAARISAKWRRDNPAHAAFLSRRSKTRRRTAQAAVVAVRFTPAQLASRVAYFGGRCWMCGDAYSHMDHVKPITAGGPEMLSNLRPACARCNFAKNGKWFGVSNLTRFIRK